MYVFLNTFNKYLFFIQKYSWSDPTDRSIKNEREQYSNGPDYPIYKHYIVQTCLT